MDEQKAIVATVRGRVQGVGFRYSTLRVAAGLDLTGWVANQPDGSVRTWAQGSAAVDRFLGFLEEGPPSSQIIGVDVVDTTPDDTLHGFEVRY